MSTLKANTFTGTTSAGSILVTGEGGSTTTNLQQGLGKHWLNLDGTGTIAISDSFNCASATDDGTGDYRPISFTNNMSNATYAGTGTTRGGSGDFSVVAISSLATDSYRLLVSDGGNGSEDADPVQTHILGDLA